MRVRVVGVHSFKDRHGKVRRYYRRKGAPRVPIDPNLKGAALAAEVARLDALYMPARVASGTLRATIIAYREDSNHWRALRPRTRKDYERVFSWLAPALDQPVALLTSPEVAKLRDLARDQHEPKFANQVVTTLKMVLRHGAEYGLVTGNAATGLSKATGGRTRANRACAPWEAIALLDEAPAALRAAIAVAIYCGLREGDVCALPRNAVDGDWLAFQQGKTRRQHEAPITADLRAILSAIPVHYGTTLLVSSRGTPWTLEGLKTAWGRHKDRLEAEGKIRPGVTFHGLRHTGATILAEAGYEEAQYRHFLGHGPKSVSGHYARSASRRALVMEMGVTIAAKLREARGNVVRIGNGSGKPE